VHHFGRYRANWWQVGLVTMTGMAAPTLQLAVDRFSRALKVSSKLLALHPHGVGNPGHAAALSPAITLAVLSAFEGFAEDYTATALYLSGDGFGQIAAKIGKWNNPTVRDFAARMKVEFPGIEPKLGHGFSLKVYKPPAGTAGSGWWNEEAVSWTRALSDADSWMQVRHCLTHGLATGWQSERWPGPIRGSISATSVLRPRGSGKHSLVLHGALSCARIYIGGARHVADLSAAEMGQTLDWRSFPDFSDGR
jgi:hypothetical protein